MELQWWAWPTGPSWCCFPAHCYRWSFLSCKSHSYLKRHCRFIGVRHFPAQQHRCFHDGIDTEVLSKHWNEKTRYLNPVKPSQEGARQQLDSESLSNSAAQVKEFSYSREVRNEEKTAAAFYQVYSLQSSSAFGLYFSPSQKSSCRLNCSLSLSPLHSHSLGPSSWSSSSVIQVLDLQMILLSHLLHSSKSLSCTDKTSKCACGCN